MAIFGSKTLAKGAKGPEVAELQLRLAGFQGTVWDGSFGAGTETQVKIFQRDYLKMVNPTGIVEEATFQGLKRFATEFPIDFAKLVCPNCSCPGKGFGQGRFKGQYLPDEPRSERTHKYEYPGFHKAILHAYRAAQLYATQAGYSRLTLVSGYRCWIDNEKHGRTTANHMGKAVDFGFPEESGEAKKSSRANTMRALMMEKCNFQIAWSNKNQKSLEPANIAPTWVHMDVRCYVPELLDDRFFVKSAEQLDSDEV